MRKFILLLCLSFFLSQTFGQKQKAVSLYLQAEYNKTRSDQTRGNNPWGIGLGLQTLFLINKKIPFKPTIEFTADEYLWDDKVYRTTTDGTPLDGVRGMMNLFAGTTYQPIKDIYLSFTAGPSFIGGRTLAGIKPSLGFYLPENHRVMLKVSYINVFNRGLSNEDFTSISFSLGIKLF
jgi:type II secretory pathway pseudopilin PulG